MEKGHIRLRLTTKIDEEPTSQDYTLRKMLYENLLSDLNNQQDKQITFRTVSNAEMLMPEVYRHRMDGLNVATAGKSFAIAK